MSNTSIKKASRKQSDYTRKDSENNDMLKSHAYWTLSEGYVTANVDLTTAAHRIRGYVGKTSNPAGEGDMIRNTQIGGATYEVSIDFHVPKNRYFEVTSDSGTPIIWWQSNGRLKKPVDYN